MNVICRKRLLKWNPKVLLLNDRGGKEHWYRRGKMSVREDRCESTTFSVSKRRAEEEWKGNGTYGAKGRQKTRSRDEN